MLAWISSAKREPTRASLTGDRSGWQSPLEVPLRDRRAPGPEPRVPAAVVVEQPRLGR